MLDNNQKTTPINRNNLFYSEEDFAFDEEIAYDYMTQDVNQTIVYFPVDYERSNINQVYQETKMGDIVLKTIIELPVMYHIAPAELKSYDTKANNGLYVNTGQLTFEILEKVIKDYGCEIRMGDYVGVPITSDHMEFYVVVNDGRKNYDNLHTLYGVRPISRSVTCAYVDWNEFRG